MYVVIYFANGVFFFSVQASDDGQNFLFPFQEIEAAATDEDELLLSVLWS